MITPHLRCIFLTTTVTIALAYLDGNVAAVSPRPTRRSHAHRCSRLTRQHGGEQSGLVTLTFDLLTLKVVSESRDLGYTSVPILFFLGLSVLDLGPMYATDTSDVRNQTSSLYASAY